jgi:hypothetical protein
VIAQARGRRDPLLRVGQDWESATVYGAALERFIMGKGEIYLTGFGPSGSDAVRIRVAPATWPAVA